MEEYSEKRISDYMKVLKENPQERPSFLQLMSHDKAFGAAYLDFLTDKKPEVRTEVVHYYQTAQRAMNPVFALGTLMDLGMNSIRGTTFSDMYVGVAGRDLPTAFHLVKAVDLNVMTVADMKNLSAAAQQGKPKDLAGIIEKTQIALKASVSAMAQPAKPADKGGKVTPPTSKPN